MHQAFHFISLDKFLSVVKKYYYFLGSQHTLENYFPKDSVINISIAVYEKILLQELLSMFFKFR